MRRDAEMIKRIFNKKAYNQILSPWFIFVITFTGLVIIAGIYMYYTTDIDVRKQEAVTMNNKIVMSIAENGYFNDIYLNSDAMVTKLAGLSYSVIDSKDFYFNVTIYNEDYTEIKNFILGNPDFEFQCRIPGKNYAKCKDSEMLLTDKNDNTKLYRVRILTASNQKSG
jgi:hypothetical protein